VAVGRGIKPRKTKLPWPGGEGKKKQGGTLTSVQRPALVEGTKGTTSGAVVRKKPSNKKNKPSTTNERARIGGGERKRPWWLGEYNTGHGGERGDAGWRPRSGPKKNRTSL